MEKPRSMSATSIAIPFLLPAKWNSDPHLHIISLPHHFELCFLQSVLLIVQHNHIKTKPQKKLIVNYQLKFIYENRNMERCNVPFLLHRKTKLRKSADTVC